MPRSIRWVFRQRPRVVEPFIGARRRSQCLGALVAAIVLLASVPHAEAATCRQRNFVDSLNLGLRTTSPIRATSSNGQTYDRIDSAGFEATIVIDLCYPGAINDIVVHLGACTGHRGGCLSLPLMYDESPSARDFRKTRSFSFTVPAGSHVGQQVLDACNARADDARGASEDLQPFPFGLPVDVTLGVETRRDHGQLGNTWTRHEGRGAGNPLREYSKTRSIRQSLSVACAPLPEPVKAPPKVSEAALSVATSGNTCPKPATADVIIAAEASRAVFYKIERGNGTTTTSDWIEGQIKKQKGPTGAQSAFLRAEHDVGALDPGIRKFRLWIDGWGKTPWREVEVDCPPFKVTSAWLKYDVEDKATCPKNVAETATFKATRLGNAPFEIKTQGGLVVHSGTVTFEREGMGYVAKVQRPNLSVNAFDSDMMALIRDQPDANSGWVRLKVECLDVLSGTLDMRTFAANRCEGEAALSIRTSMPGKVPYQLDCTGGRSWSGVTQAQKTGPETYIGVDTKRFDVTNNEQVNCALKTRAPMPVKVLALKGQTYECHKPADASGSSDLAPETRPDDPPPTGRALAGDFSFIDNGSPRCPRQGKALINFTSDGPENVHYSLDCTHGSFSGVAQTEKGAKGGYIAPALVSFDIEKTTQANCALKTVAPGKPKVHTLKGYLFQCVTPSGVSGSSDLAHDPHPDPQGPRVPSLVIIDPPRVPHDSSGPGKVSDPPQRISCAGGVVKKGECLCPRTHKAVHAGKNAWRCMKSAVIDPPRKGSDKASTSSAAGTGKRSNTQRDAAAEQRRLKVLKRAREAKRKGAAKKAGKGGRSAKN